METWSDLTWKDENESTKETDRSREGGRGKIGEYDLTETFGRKFIHSFIHSSLSTPAALGVGNIGVNAKFPDFVMLTFQERSIQLLENCKDVLWR